MQHTEKSDSDYLWRLICDMKAHEFMNSVREAVADERNACASKAREFAEHYPQSSDGRNTLIMLAEWIENRPNQIEQ